MALFGEVVVGKIVSDQGHCYEIDVDGRRYHMDKQDLEPRPSIGDTIQGFTYENKHHQAWLTSHLPQVRQDHFGWGEVVDVRRDLGVFVDIGLPDKDIVVSLDDLPDNAKFWPKKGDRLYLCLKVDSHDRVWGHLAEEILWHDLFNKAKSHTMNNNVQATVYRILVSGAQLITAEGYAAYLHAKEMVAPVRLGQVLEARIIDVHPDGRVNLSTRPRAHEAIEDDAQMILAILERRQDHFLPLHDKSEPDAITDFLGISKGQFKRAVGHLLKAGRIRQEKGLGLYLKED